MQKVYHTQKLSIDIYSKIEYNINVERLRKKKRGCFMFCSRCGKEIDDDAVVCIHCGCAVENRSVSKEEDVINVWLCLLSVIIPLFGIIYWAVKYKEVPKKAKACGMAAIITILVSFVLGVLATCAATVLISDMISDMANNLNYY